MAFKLSDINTEVKECEIAYGENTLHFSYRTMAYTPNHEDAVEEAVKQNKLGTTLKAMLLPLIVSWDVVEEITKKNGKGPGTIEEIPVPLTEEGLGRVPLRVLGDINRAINRDMIPGEANSTNSEGSFS